MKVAHLFRDASCGGSSEALPTSIIFSLKEPLTWDPGVILILSYSPENERFFSHELKGNESSSNHQFSGDMLVFKVLSQF